MSEKERGRPRIEWENPDVGAFFEFVSNFKVFINPSWRVVVEGILPSDRLVPRFYEGAYEEDGLVGVKARFLTKIIQSTSEQKRFIKATDLTILLRYGQKAE